MTTTPAKRSTRPSCRKCGRPILYNASLGAYWCDTIGCSTWATAPKEDSAHPEAAQHGDARRGPAQAQSAPEAESVAVVVTLADVERQEVDWLWMPGRIPKGRLVMVDGDPGVGKSWLTLAIATPITIGGALPGDTTDREPAKVLLLTAEDGLADTVRPRLEDMGPDLSRVRILTAVQDEKGSQRTPSLVEDLAALDEVLSEGGYALVVIDPVNAYLGSQLDTHRDAALRSVLAGLAALAERWGVAVLCVRHLTKGSRDKAIYRGQGNIAYIAAARVAYLIGQNPDDPRERVMICIKNNLAPIPPSLAFEIADARFLWRGESSISAAALLAPDAEEGERGQLEDAVDFLETLLADGPVDVAQIRTEREDVGISPSTLKRAKVKLGVLSQRQGGLADKGRWTWALPTKGTKALLAAKGTKSPHTVLLAPLEREIYKTPSPLGPLSTADGTPSAKGTTGPHLENLAPLGEPAKKTGGHLVRLALELGAKLKDSAEEGEGFEI